MADEPVYAPTRESLAEIFDLGLRSIGRYLAQGAPAKVEGQGYSVGGWWRWLNDRRPAGVPKDLAREEAERQRSIALAELAQLRVEDARRRLIPHEEAERQVEALADLFDRLFAIAGPELASRLSRVRSPGSVRKIVDSYWYNVRKELAARIRHHAQA